MNQRYDDDALAERVREALHRDAELIEPPEALGQILARSAARRQGSARRRRRWRTVGVVAAAGLATAVTVFAVTTIGDPFTEDRGPAAAVDVQPAALYYLDAEPERTGEAGSEQVEPPRLYREIRSVEVGANPVRGAVRALLNTSPRDPDYVNPWAQLGAEVEEVEVRDRTITVDLTAVPESALAGGGTPPGHKPVVQQLVYTAQRAAGSRAGVVVEVDGEPQYGGRALRPRPPLRAFARIWIDQPDQGATVRGPVEFRGMAGGTFEGNVAWEIRRRDEVVASGAEIAGSMFAWSSWSFRRPLEPGEYTVIAYDEDPAHGGRRDVDSKSFTVRDSR